MGMDRDVVGLIDRLFGRDGRGSNAHIAVLYAAIVDRARQPGWYVEGGVPDTIDGRFDMVAAILVMVLLRLETDPEAAADSAMLTERFIDDMDAQLRESGFGDVGIGKRVGRMVSMLGGRLSAYREGLEAGDLDAALARNLYRGAPPAPEEVRHVSVALTNFRTALASTPTSLIVSGRLP